MPIVVHRSSIVMVYTPSERRDNTPALKPYHRRKADVNAANAGHGLVDVLRNGGLGDDRVEAVRVDVDQVLEAVNLDGARL